MSGLGGFGDSYQRFGRTPGKYVQLDPDEVMVGTCSVCKTRVRTTRRKTTKDKKSPANASLGGWIDLPYIECTVCKERSAELIKKAGTSKQAVGTRVYVGPKPYAKEPV